MRVVLLLLFSTLLSLQSLTAQKASLEGLVTDAVSGKKITGVSVSINGDKTVATTNIDGIFTLSLDAVKKYSIKLSSVGYTTKEISDIELVAGKLTHIDVLLSPASKTENAVVVKSSARKETAAALISFQKTTNTVASAISAEAIRRSPDKHTGEVLKRLPGTSVQDGKYLIVRGLADRYNQAMLNGILLSSTEPDRKTFSFDMFPSSIVENIIINKAFVPELPGEWAGGLVQVNTKDIPSKNFFNVQIGTGFNTNVTGHAFYGYNGSSTDFLGFDSKVRTLPSSFPLKSAFASLTAAEKLEAGKQIATDWSVNKATEIPNLSLQASGGLSGKLFRKKVGAVLAINYNRGVKRYENKNSYFSVDNSIASPYFLYNTNRYATEVLLGGIANFSLQLNNNNKITIKNLINVNGVNATSLRTGQEFISGDADNVRIRELMMRTNIFFNTQVSGEHQFSKTGIRANWYGSFNILDQYIPQQRRLEYVQNGGVGAYEARVSTGQSQKSGSVFYSNLSDYIYTAGGDLSGSFKLFGRKQLVKAGYFFQVKDRLFDSRPFYIQLFDNSLKTLPEEQLFNPTNFVNGKLGFDEFSGKQYRYMANSILNAGFVQFDNYFTSKLRAVWGVRVEDFDQLIGSVKESDPRHVHSQTRDFLPAMNLTYKLDTKTNIRLSASQTVVRPEFRELSDFSFYDFELGATVIGNRNLVRTKISNIDLRYELYPRAGEMITAGVFYKYFKSPIEQYFNGGAGNSNTFNYPNNDDIHARGYGVELEIRKKLDVVKALRNFTLSSNVSYIYNRVRSGAINLDRPMQGQSPYLLNIGLQYDLDRYGITSTLLYNQIGRRIAYVGNDQIPAIWEAPRPLLDWQLTKKLVKDRADLKLTVSDIFNTKANFYHDLNTDGKFSKKADALAIQRRYGTTFSLSFAYRFR